MSTLPRTTATRQFAGLVLAEIETRDGQLQRLRDLLREIGEQTTAAMQGRPAAEPIVPFSRLATVHYARFVIIADFVPSRPLLAFSTNYDGSEGEACSARRALEHHLDDLVQNAGPGLERVFSHCRGYRAGQLRRFLRSHQRRAATFYVGSSGRSRSQILWEAELRRRVDHILDTGDYASSLPEQVRAAVLERLRAGYPSIPSFPPQPDLSGRLRWLKALAAVLGLGSAALAASLLGPLGSASALTAILLGAALLVLRFRQLEKTDAQFQPQYSAENVRQFGLASAEENIFLQNQLTHLVPVKPGPLRWLLIRVVFAALDLLVKYQYNKGKLGDIPSIHFARWVLIPNRGVLFFSNFDSSWQSYLGDFIDQASSGLTAVWSNTVGYPRTTWLLRAGSRDAQRFLAWTRHYQRPTQVWYAAYPGLSIVNVNANTEIRRGLAEPQAVDATTWLFLLRSVDRQAADEQYSEERTREPPLPLQDIQGIILWGYGHVPEARYLMLRVRRRDAGALKWLSELPLASAAAESKTDEPPEPLVNVAFTYRGLRELGVDETLCNRFSTPFVQGSEDEYRARVNGDVGADAPSEWEWGGPHNPVHIVLLIYAKTKASLAGFVEAHQRAAEQHGLELVVSLEGTTLPERKEHFGFRDGIAQPTVEGSGRAEVQDNTVAAGEFLLGHPDGYGNVSHSPVSSAGFAFGANGSYLVFRQLEQDVPAFWRYCSAQRGFDALTMAAKMVGRWPSGAPLVRHAERDPELAVFADDDHFSYLTGDEDNDRYGARCPFGAHIRRANPRDWQLGTTRADSLKLSNLHRIIRRGRPYGPPLVASMAPAALLTQALAGPADGARRGLQFLCFNASIERQFEFVQQQWLSNPKFAGQSSDADPVLGMRQPPLAIGSEPATFTVQSDVKTGLCPRATGLQHFVRVLGSAYFFMPSIPAVRLLGSEIARVSVAESLERIPDDEQLHIDNLVFTLREKMKRDYAGRATLRDAHPKMHGLVRAWFKVEPNLEEELRVGVFREAKTYQAYVRISNASGTVQKDTTADIRGAAIKLIGVPGAKLLEGAEDSSTQDFLLISHDEFVTRDVAEFDALVQAMAAGGGELLAFLVSHPRIALKIFQASKRHSDLLAIQYSSVVPYLFGARAVKYVLRPLQHARPPLSLATSPDFLQQRLKQSLSEEPASFEFLIQERSDPDPRAIEDPSVAWSARGGLRRVATLEIPPQDFDTLDRRVLGENLSFNPWRCLPEHRPLGGISRARRQVYRALSSFRHDRNSAANQEPSGW